MDTKQKLKETFSTNLQFYLDLNNKSQMDLCRDLNFTSSTVSDWINAKKYPRMDKVQILADYFHIRKSDLTDDPNDYYEEIANREGWLIPDDFYPELDQEDRLKRYYEFKRAEEQDHYREIEDNIQFTSVDEAMLFIIQNPTVAAYGGYDIEHMSDEEKIEFANQIADTIKFFGQKYKK